MGVDDIRGGDYSILILMFIIMFYIELVVSDNSSRKILAEFLSIITMFAHQKSFATYNSLIFILKITKCFY